MSRLLAMPSRHDREAPVGEAQRNLQGARLLLLTGTGGSGKRILGNLLVDERSYVHIDLDNTHANRRFLGRGLDGLKAELEANLEPGQDTVVTWTPDKSGALPFVRLMQLYGFDWVWLDGDRGAAFYGFFAARVGETARFVDPFAADGRFRPVGPVLAEILEPGPQVQPLPARRRMPRELALFGRLRARRPVSRPHDTEPARPQTAGRIGGRTRFAAGLALGVAALAGASYALVGGDDPVSGLAVKPAQAKPAALPTRGVLVSGESLAGVRLGDTASEVRRMWGKNFTVWEGHKPTTWFYLYPTGDPVGAGVTFRNGRVTAVFTLGMKVGWRTDDGLKVGDLMSHKTLNDDRDWTLCSGYSAKSERSGDAVTSILTVGPAIYGFSLTRPSESVCR